MNGAPGATGPAGPTGTVDYAVVTNIVDGITAGLTNNASTNAILLTLYHASTTGLVVNAGIYNSVIIPVLTHNMTMLAPTNAPTDRRCVVAWSLRASGGDRTVTWPSATFKIPRSSTMPETVTVSNNTESIFLIEYRTNAPNWKLETYVWGY